MVAGGHRFGGDSAVKTRSGQVHTKEAEGQMWRRSLSHDGAWTCNSDVANNRNGPRECCSALSFQVVTLHRVYGTSECWLHRSATSRRNAALRLQADHARTGRRPTRTLSIEDSTAPGTFYFDSSAAVGRRDGPWFQRGYSFGQSSAVQRPLARSAIGRWRSAASSTIETLSD